jgi:hypothetical protein
VEVQAGAQDRRVVYCCMDLAVTIMAAMEVQLVVLVMAATGPVRCCTVV